MIRSHTPALALATAVLTLGLGHAGEARADLSSKVIGSFRGQIVLSKEELTPGKNDAATIAEIKKVRLKELDGSANADDVVTWKFHYTAFLNRTGSSALKLEFYIDDKDARYVADQRLDGIDPKSSVLSGDITINEDEGLAKGKSYVIKLSADVKGKDVIVATTPVTMK
jgi:hypothetical protein